MATLVGNVNSSVTEWTVSAAISHDIDYLSLDSETVQVLTHTPSQLDPQTRVALPPKIRVRRGSGGTTAASHLSGVTLTPVIPPAAAGGGAGGLTVTDGVTSVEATTLLLPAGTVGDAGAGVAIVTGLTLRLVRSGPIDWDTPNLNGIAGVVITSVSAGQIIYSGWVVILEQWASPTPAVPTLFADEVAGAADVDFWPVMDDVASADIESTDIIGFPADGIRRASWDSPPTYSTMPNIVAEDITVRLRMAGGDPTAGSLEVFLIIATPAA